MFIDKKIYEIYPINPTYPDMLKKIPSAPKKIYAIGNISLLNEKSISVAYFNVLVSFQKLIYCRLVPFMR